MAHQFIELNKRLGSNIISKARVLFEQLNTQQQAVHKIMIVSRLDVITASEGDIGSHLAKKTLQLAASQ